MLLLLDMQLSSANVQHSQNLPGQFLGTIKEMYAEVSRQTVELRAQISRKMTTLLLEILRETNPDMQSSVCVLDALLLLTMNINKGSVWI